MDVPERSLLSTAPPVASRLAVQRAEKEAWAQLEIVRALNKLPDYNSRLNVKEAVDLLIEADRRVPGVLAAHARGFRNGPMEGSPAPPTSSIQPEKPGETS